MRVCCYGASKGMTVILGVGEEIWVGADKK